MRDDDTFLTGRLRHGLKLGPGVEPPDPNRPVSRGKVKVLSMGDPVPLGPEKILLMIEVVMPNEQLGRHAAHHLSHLFQIFNVEGVIAVVGAQVTVQPDVPPATS